MTISVPRKFSDKLSSPKMVIPREILFIVGVLYRFTVMHDCTDECCNCCLFFKIAFRFF